MFLDFGRNTGPPEFEFQRNLMVVISCASTSKEIIPLNIIKTKFYAKGSFKGSLNVRNSTVIRLRAIGHIFY